MASFARRIALALVLSACAFGARAQVVLTGPGIPATESFDALPASGTAEWVNNVILPGWYHARVGTGTTILAGNGSGTTGALYSFGTGAATERALGSIGSANAAVGNLYWGIRLRNDTGETITTLTVSYTGEQWRNSAAAAQTIAFSYLVGTPVVTGTLAEFQSVGTPVAQLDFTSPVTGGSAAALDGNAAANRVAIEHTITGLSIPVGTEVMLRWSDPDHTGNDHGLSIDDFSVVANAGGPVVPVVSVGNQSADEGNSGTTPFMFTFSLSAPSKSPVAIAYATADGTATAGSDYIATSGTANIAAGATSVTVNVLVNGDTEVEPDETFFVDITAATGAVIGNARGTATIVNDDVVVTPIRLIQGTGATSPLVGSVVTTVGIVTGRKSNGYFMQTADADLDADTLASTGLFVFTAGAPPAAAAVGNRVRTTGTVAEYVPAAEPSQLPLTQLTFATTAQLAMGQPLPQPVVITAADFTAGGGLDQLERYEAMRVSVPGATVVAPTRGNINETNATATSNGLFAVVAPGIARPLREPGIQVPDPLPSDNTATSIPRWDFNAETIAVDSDVLGFARVEVAVGCSFAGDALTGPLDYTFRRYTVSPDRDLVADCSTAAPRPAPLPTADEATFGTYNLQRFFDTVNDPGISEPVLTPEAFERRLAKASAGIRDYLHLPDVLAVSEVENLSVLQTLATRVNADAVAADDPDPGYVAYLQEGFDVGGIDVGFLVRTGEVATGTPRVEVLSVEQIGAEAMLPNPDGSQTRLNDRPPLKLEAIVHFADGRTLPVTALSVHQRSLTGIESEAPEDNGWTSEGARVRAKRHAQAVDLAQRVQALQAADPARRLVVLGDFNAFQFNDGYVDAVGTVVGLPSPDDTTAVNGDGAVLVDPPLLNATLLSDASERYSFVFEYNAQAIDHILVNQALAGGGDVTGLALGHARINADFPETARNDTATVARLSDHDPSVLRVRLAALQFADLAVEVAANDDAVEVGGALSWTATVDNLGPDDAAFPGVGFAVDAVVADLAVAAPAGWDCDAAVVSGSSTSIACTSPALADGADAAFTVSGTAPASAAGASVELVVAATSQTEDPVAANDSDSAEIAVAAVADLAVEITGPAAYLRDSVVPFVLTVQNLGPSVAADAALTIAVDVPAANASLVAPAGWSCATAAGRRFAATCTADAGFAVGSAGFELAVSTLARPGIPAFNVVAGVSAATDDPVAVNDVDAAKAVLVRTLP